MYEIRLRRITQKGLDALPVRDYETVAEAIGTLEKTPRAPRVKKPADSGLWRIRLGQHRVVWSEPLQLDTLG